MVTGKMIKLFMVLFIIVGMTELAFAIELPETGQTTCYNESGAVISCAGTGQDGEIRAGVAWPSPRFTDNGNGTVTDNLTGIMWLKDANCINTNYPGFDNDDIAGDGRVNWQNALNFVAGINAGTYSTCGAGFTDWRLPNVNEIESVINIQEQDAAAWLNTQGFSNVQFRLYWSSSTHTYLTTYPWVVRMYDGLMGVNLKTDYYYVWPVRAATTSPAELWKTGQTTSYAAGDDGDLERGVAWPSPRFTDNGNGTVTDNLTGLIWLKNANCFDAPTWTNALNAANTLNNGECGLSDGSVEGDWRLPNRKELRSLSDYSQWNPPLPSGHPFTNVQTYGVYYWSSSTYAAGGYMHYAWIVDMYYGFVYADVKASSGNHYVWPVRDRINTPAAYLVWQDDSYGNNEIVLKVSPDNGATWTTQRLTTNTGSSTNPSMAISGSDLYVVWTDDTYGNNEILMKSSTDNGATWSLQRLTNNTGSSSNPSIAVSGNNLYVVWQDDSYGNNEIVLKSSTNNGSTWSTRRFTNTSGSSLNPSITISGSNLYIVWQDDSYGNNEIVLKSSTDNGSTWSTQRLTNTTGQSYNPSIAVNGSNLYVAWNDDTYGNNEIFLKRSADNGATWTFQRLTNNTGVSDLPSVKVDGSNIYIVWSDSSYGNREIVLKRSSDAGATWSTQRFTNIAGSSSNPSVAVNGNNLYVVWNDDTYGNNEIFLKRSSDGGATWSLSRMTNNTGASLMPVIAR